MRTPLDRRAAPLAAVLLTAFVVAVLPLIGQTQTTAPNIDTGHSHAELWMGRDTEVTVVVNVAVAQVGGNITLVTGDPTASTLEFALVPGGQDAELLTAGGTLRRDALARLMRFTTMTFHTTRTRIRRDGLLEFAGELAFAHTTREQIRPAWNSTYTAPSYSDPETTRGSGNVAFVLATPRAEFLEPYLKKSSDVVISATVHASEMPGLPDAVLDAFWPAFAQDDECPPVNTAYGVRDNISLLCHGKSIAVVPSLQKNQTFGIDYSGRRKNDAPPEGPVTLALYLKLAARPASPPSR